MQPPHPGASPDALLVQRVAALADKAALAELDARHGMTLYALAYSLVFDAEAADLAVAGSFREVWRSAASFDPRGGTVQRWLADLTRGSAVQQRLRTGPEIKRSVFQRPPAAFAGSRRGRWADGLARLARVAAILVLPALLLR